jgi:hypothetical protein
VQSDALRRTQTHLELIIRRTRRGPQSSSTYRLSDRRVLDVGDLRRLRRTDASMHVVNGGRDRAREQAVLFGAVEEPLALDYPVREVGRQPE